MPAWLAAGDDANAAEDCGACVAPALSLVACAVEEGNNLMLMRLLCSPAVHAVSHTLLFAG